MSSGHIVEWRREVDSVDTVTRHLGEISKFTARGAAIDGEIGFDRERTALDAGIGIGHTHHQRCQWRRVVPSPRCAHRQRRAHIVEEPAKVGMFAALVQVDRAGQIDPAYKGQFFIDGQWRDATAWRWHDRASVIQISQVVIAAWGQGTSVAGNAFGGVIPITPAIKPLPKKFPDQQTAPALEGAHITAGVGLPPTRLSPDHRRITPTRGTILTEPFVIPRYSLPGVGRGFIKRGVIQHQGTGRCGISTRMTTDTTALQQRANIAVEFNVDHRTVNRAQRRLAIPILR